MTTLVNKTFSTGTKLLDIAQAHNVHLAGDGGVGNGRERQPKTAGSARVKAEE